MYHVLPKHLKPCQFECITYIDYILRGYNFTYHIEHGTDIENWLSASHIPFYRLLRNLFLILR